MSDKNDATDLVDAVEDLAGDEGEVSVRDMVEAIGHRGFGPLIFVPALVVVSPLGGIPGVPTLFALIIVLIAVQILVGRTHFWLPDMIGERSVSDDRVRKSADKARPVARWMDKWLGSRLESLTGKTARIAAAVAVVGLCILVPPLELVPFAAIVPMLAIAVIGLALTARDGVLMLVGLVAAGVALITAWNMLISA
ncbi:exopolysaccharide biosynthesis protein [Roseovarius sp. SCSIO 43702]|uniref:exopolysaccharide biosynthesis protein n=1 Tax=Roseovarius sp. SCSIO 43702 TaxID=2823043 RepID=UPI001C7354C6|nr:exopolysaccharide biosynthesis protein [Roseovarius sp. SCSIO 43702]QYX56482.1 exopolysaccharide biosynthesis protein [Roseovarius sp. SCSIO 43702]